jgi:hypothetical protein
VTDEQPSHVIRLWLSEHDGWEAWVAEHACAPALFGLARLSQHDACGALAPLAKSAPCPQTNEPQHSETES